MLYFLKLASLSRQENSVFRKQSGDRTGKCLVIFHIADEENLFKEEIGKCDRKREIQ